MSRRRRICLLMLAAQLLGCSAFQPASQPLAELVAPPKPVDRVRVVLTTGATLAVWAPSITSDTLHGFTSRPGPEATPLAIPLPLVTRTDVRKIDAVPTVLLVSVVILFIAGMGSYGSSDGF